MQRSGAATCRFYAAFYRWTLRSANPTRRCAGTTSTLVARRKQSTTHGVSVPSQRHSEPVWTSEQLRKEAVQSDADRPTESLDLWEHAVREKSKKKVTLELSVPRRALYSKDVHARARIHEVKLSFKLSSPGYREDAGDDEPCAVFLEGDYTDVKAVWKHLYTHGAGQSSNASTAAKKATHVDVEPIPHRSRQDFAREQQQTLVEKERSLPESFWQPIGKEGTIEYLSTRYGLHVDLLDQSGPLQYARLKGSETQIREVDILLENIHTWELEEKEAQSIFRKTARKEVEIFRRNDLPAESLELWQAVTRKQLQGRTEIDVCLPEGLWQRITRNGGAENLHARFAIEFKPLEVPQDGKRRFVSLKGDVEHVDRAKSYLKGFQVNVPQLQNDEEYLRIHSAVTWLPTANEPQLQNDEEYLRIHSAVTWPPTANEPQLQNDEEYLRIHSAVTWLPTANDAKQRRSARRSQEETGSNKLTVQAPSEKPHKSPETSSPEKKSTPKNTVSDKLHETRHAELALDTLEDQQRRSTRRSEKETARNKLTGQALSEKPHKSPETSSPEKKSTHKITVSDKLQETRHAELALNTPEDQSAHDNQALIDVPDMERFAVPEHIKQELESSDESTLAQIQQRSRLQSIVRLETPESKQYLKFVGPRANRERAKALLQESIDYDNKRTGRRNPGVKEISVPPLRARKTHVAWMQMPEGTKFNSKPRVRICRETDTGIDIHVNASGKQIMQIVGQPSLLKLAMAKVQLVIDERRKETSKSPARFEILKMGLIEDVGEEWPAKSSVKAAEAKQQSSSTSGETYQKSTVNKATAPEASEVAEQATKQSNQQLSDDMRSALRHITQPVALVTSLAPRSHPRQAKREQARGVTVSSFCTVTLHPIPVVSFNLRVPSRSWDAISASGYLRVHLLKASPEGAAVAHAFTLPCEQPYQPFEQLAQSGMRMSFSRKTDPAKAPHIRSHEAILAHFVARVIPEKCIQVGDHMIVVAEVTETMFAPAAAAAASITSALSYGRRGYRQLGNEIKPMELKPAEPKPSDAQPAKEVRSTESIPDNGEETTKQHFAADHVKPDQEASKKIESVPNAVKDIMEPVEQESDHVQPSESAPDDIAAKDMADLYERFSADPDEGFETAPAPAPKNIEDLGPSSPMLDEESLRQVLKENEAAYSSMGLPSQTAADNPALAEALNAVAGAYGDAAEPAVSSQPESTSQTPAPLVDQPSDAATPPQTEAPSDARPAKSATREERPANALSTGKGPWGMGDSMTQQIRKMSIYHTSPPRRHYSTNDSNPGSPDQPPHPPLSKQILKTTAADYLCQIPTHRKRYKTLINLQRSAEDFEAQLQLTQASISEEEAAALSTKAQVARRQVARELALRNAQDLRAMLDKGRVAATAAQWLESNLEQGQVSLLTEAKVLRRELEAGKLKSADFERAKAELTSDYETIDAQLMRLKDFAEDDVEELDDGGEFGEGNNDGKEGTRA